MSIETGAVTPFGRRRIRFEAVDGESPEGCGGGPPT